MWVCITILGFAVVPEVKNSSSGSIRTRYAVRREFSRRVIRILYIVTNPRVSTYGQPRGYGVNVFKFGSLVSSCHDEPNLSSGATVGKIIETEHRCCGNKHGTELHCCEHRLPKRRYVTHHEQQPVPTANAETTKMACHSRRSLGEFCEC